MTSAYEIRVSGPNVTPGYFARPDLTAAAFDEQGYYRPGDAVAFADPGDPGAGLVFRGRIAVLACRAALVAMPYTDPAPAGVIIVAVPAQGATS